MKLFKKIRDTKGTLHAKIGTIKDRNSIDLTKQKMLRRRGYNIQNQFSSVQFSRSVVSDSLRPHGLQHTRPPCPSPTPTLHPHSRPLSQ